MRTAFVSCVVLLLMTAGLLADVAPPFFGPTRRTHRPPRQLHFSPRNAVPIRIQLDDGPPRVRIPRALLPRAERSASGLGGVLVIGAVLPLAFCLRRRARAALFVAVALAASGPLVEANGPFLPSRLVEGITPARPPYLEVDGLRVEVVEAGDRIQIFLPRAQVDALKSPTPAVATQTLERR